MLTSLQAAKERKRVSTSGRKKSRCEKFKKNYDFFLTKQNKVTQIDRDVLVVFIGSASAVIKR